MRRTRPVVRTAALACAAAVLSGCSGPAPAARGNADVLVFAAASLSSVLEAMKPRIVQDTGVTLRASYASSATLARQIESGAPADLFIPADPEWMDALGRRGLIQPPPAPVAGNTLVLIASTQSRLELRLEPGVALRDALGGARLAIGDPASVPAGKYAKQALTYLGAWTKVQDRLAPGENVRVALQFVARGECPLGIVYASDAASERAVRIVATFPERSHAPIVYPAAVMTHAPHAPAAARVLAWLQSDAAHVLFARYGFTAPGPAGRS